MSFWTSDLEIDRKMIKRVMGELMSAKNIVVINDEAHHCYREKSFLLMNENLKGDDKKEADKNKEAAPLMDNWHRSSKTQIRCARCIRFIRYTIFS